MRKFAVPPVDKEVKCCKCKQPFIATTRNAKYCSSCRVKIKNGTLER